MKNQRLFLSLSCLYASEIFETTYNKILNNLFLVVLNGLLKEASHFGWCIRYNFFENFEKEKVSLGYFLSGFLIEFVYTRFLRRLSGVFFGVMFFGDRVKTKCR